MRVNNLNPRKRPDRTGKWLAFGAAAVWGLALGLLYTDYLVIFG